MKTPTIQKINFLDYLYGFGDIINNIPATPLGRKVNAHFGRVFLFLTPASIIKPIKILPFEPFV